MSRAVGWLAAAVHKDTYPTMSTYGGDEGGVGGIHPTTPIRSDRMTHIRYTS